MAYEFMSDGWSVFNRKQDDREIEWQAFKELVGEHWYWFATHIIFGEIVRLSETSRIISLAYFLMGSLACVWFFNIKFFFVLLMQTFLSYGVSSVSKKKRYPWMLASAWLLTLNILKMDAYYEMMIDWLDSSDSRVPAFLVVFAWCILKNISFNLERITSDNENADKFGIIDCLGYVFYMPTFHCGPFFLYSRYMTMLDNLRTNKLLAFGCRIKRLVLQLARYGFWFIVIEASLHFFYIHSLTISIDAESLDNSTLAGLGFLKGMFFNIKYIIFYGIPIAIGEFESIPMPSAPKCICRIHKFSDMWKSFDNGLYEFLFKYIYTQMTTRSSSLAQKLLGSVITFSFIYIWHGFYVYILIWCAANFACIVLEKIVYGIIDSYEFKSRALALVRTEDGVHLLKVAIATHVMIPAVISNAFFFGGIDYGKECVKRTFTHGFLNYFKVWGSFCFLYPLAEAIKLHKQRKGKLSTTTE
jgi:hypothetical protein